MPAAAGAASGSVGVQNNNVRRTSRNNKHAASCPSGCANDANGPRLRVCLVVALPWTS